MNALFVSHYPSPRTMSLPPLSKVRCCRPKKFGRLPEGLSRHHLSPRTNPFQNRTTPLTFLNANIYMHLYAFTFALSHALFVGRGARPSRCTKPLHSHSLLKSTSTATPRTKIAFLAKGELLLLGLTEPTMVWIVIV